MNGGGANVDIDAFSGDPPTCNPPPHAPSYFCLQPQQPPPQRFIKQAHPSIKNDQKKKLKTAAIKSVKKGMQRYQRLALKVVFLWLI